MVLNPGFARSAMVLDRVHHLPHQTAYDSRVAQVEEVEDSHDEFRPVLRSLVEVEVCCG